MAAQASHPRRCGAVLWPLAAAGLAGAVSFVATDLMALSREMFLVPHVLVATALSAAFVHHEGIDVADALRRSPGRTAFVTTVAAVLMVGTVMLQPGASHAHGARLAFELFWDGAVYGLADGLLLTVLPITAVRLALPAGRLGADALGLLASIGVFVVYHLGFAEFRGTAIGAPMVAGVVFGAAYLTSRNPLAPTLAHAAMHVAAVLHGPAGTAQLPPHY